MGGVLVDLDIEDCKRAFKEYLGYYRIDEIIDPCHQKGIYGDLEEGILSAEDFRQIVLSESRPGSLAEDVDRAMWHILTGIEEDHTLKDMFAEIGEDCYIEPPLHANWAGKNVHFGKYVYANFNVTFVDDTHIYVGDYTMLGPNVVIATGGHPILPELRQQGMQYNMPVHIGSNCWLGAGVIVMPGVTIGDNSVIGAGSVVTKDIPSGVVAVGNPCRVLREVGEHDRIYYYKDRKIDWGLL